MDTFKFLCNLISYCFYSLYLFLYLDALVSLMLFQLHLLSLHELLFLCLLPLILHLIFYFKVCAVP